ncbi:multiple resistance and pH regulation protein F [Dyella halodurans]|uniref:Monovalent cation/H+ antiporter complex subunit F n=1 Tax=Dyella halodurans TaxID=1920171 RepID=A0ABV9C252_9GAMM|nr:monovalent cation/H+ antiporter complex subunit F [Dyella halodurans]
MTSFLLAMTFFVVVMVAVGLFCVLRGASNADRMMAVQLFGTGGIAALLLAGVANGTEGVVEVVLTLSVLAAFAAVAFVKADESGAKDDDRPEQGP